MFDGANGSLVRFGAGSGARTRDLRMSQTPQGVCTSYDCHQGCPMSPTRYQLRHPGLVPPCRLPPLKHTAVSKWQIDRSLHSLHATGPVMVDLNTAMAAAAAEQKRRSSDGNQERKKRRTGKDMGIEAFDPVTYVAKERADTASMWLVLTFSLTVSLLMRYVLMPNTDPSKSDILYLLPLAAIVLIPQVHRIVMPERFMEHYTRGTWFKSGFLHMFTFLALSFMLVNPPLGDIVAPQLSGEWTIATDDGEELVFANDNGKDGEITWTVAQDASLTGEIWLLFGLADNVNSDGATVTVGLANNDVNNAELASNSTFWEDHIDRINDGRTLDNSSGTPNLIPHGESDQPFAVLLSDSGLSVGVHTISVFITENGDPWENTRNYTWTLRIVEELPEADAS